MTLRCWHCHYFRAATTLVNGKPACRTCTRELVAKPRDITIAPAPKRLALSIALAIALMCGTSVAADEACACDEATDGARVGEGLDARVERLRLQLRLSVAEQRVARSARR